MYYVTIDCGTTNSRIYIVDSLGKVFSKGKKNVGVKDTAITGSNEVLINGLKELFNDVLKMSNINMSEIKIILSSGMITSELGIKEIPHISAPCNINDLAKNIVKVDNIDLTGSNIPMYFIPGIKNKYNKEKIDYNHVDSLDFMRGEETQVIGLIRNSVTYYPKMVIILSSHTKFILIDTIGKIYGSITTMSGQLYDAIINHTFVGKSINDDKKNNDYNEIKILELAKKCSNSYGIIRSLMFPRFMDVLLDTSSKQRKLFLDALIAYEDIKVIPYLKKIKIFEKYEVIIIGDKERSELYKKLLSQEMKNAKGFTIIDDNEKIDQISIDGILTIAKYAKLI